MEKISLKDSAKKLSRNEMKNISGGDFLIKNCVDPWGKPCGGHNLCTANFQCEIGSICYHDYCSHIG